LFQFSGNFGAGQLGSGFHTLFVLFGIPVDFEKHIGVSQKRAQAGFGAKINGPPAIGGMREVRRINVPENAPA
jgi:hypothetical protein